LLKAVIKKHSHVVGYLLSLHMDPNEYGEINGLSCLMYACKQCNFDSAKLLIESGANVNDTTDKQKSTQLLACERENKNLEIIKLLFQYGAEIDDRVYKKIKAYHIILTENKGDNDNCQNFI
jgi:ankyrin repeat protein